MYLEYMMTMWTAWSNSAVSDQTFTKEESDQALHCTPYYNCLDALLIKPS